MTKWFNDPAYSDPFDDRNIEWSWKALRDAIERMDRCDEMLDDFAVRIRALEKVCVVDIGESGCSREDIAFLSDRLKERGCKSFVHGSKIIAWGEAFEKAMEREALKPIPIAPLPKDPEIERRIWMWQFSFRQ